MSLTTLSQEAFFRGDFVNAQVYAEEGLELASDINSPNPKMLALGLLSWISGIDEAYSKARELAQEGLSSGAVPDLFVAQLGMAIAATGLEAYDVARENMQTLLSTDSLYHSPVGYTSCLPVLAALYANQDEVARAVQILALAFTHPMSPVGWIEKWLLLERLQTQLKRKLGSKVYEASWERGEQLSLEAVIADAAAI